MSQIIVCIIVGLTAGVLSGLLGIGGGIIIIPALLFLFNLNQHQAQGTTLALMVPPIGLLAAWHYYRQGYVDVKIAAFICLGFFFGGLAGAKFATFINAPVLKKVFAIFLIAVAVKLLTSK